MGRVRLHAHARATSRDARRESTAGVHLERDGDTWPPFDVLRADGRPSSPAPSPTAAATVLVFSAVKVATDWRHIRPGVSVVGIALMILATVAASFWRPWDHRTDSADSILWRGAMCFAYSRES